MSEEAQLEFDLDIEAPEVEVEKEAPSYTPAEQEAMKHGWKPLEEFDGDPDDWRSAREFNDRASFFGKISEQKREISELNKKYSTVLSMQASIAAKAREDTIAELKAEKTRAYADEDFEKVVELDDKIAAERTAANIEAQTIASAPQPVDPVFSEWEQNNSWYKNDQELHDMADAHGLLYANKQVSLGRDPRSITPTEVIEYIDKKMKPMLKAPARSSTSPVEGAGNSTGKRGTKSKGFTEKDLSEDQRTIMKDLVKADPHFTKEMYIESLVEIGELTK